jgi:arginase
MDLHVIEVQVAHSSGRHGPGLRLSPEWRAYRDRGVYGPVKGRLTFAQPTLDPAEVTEDPVADLAVIGGRIAAAVKDGVRAGGKVLMVGGNCTSVPGMFGGLQMALGPTTKIGLVWIDAHGDFNTPRTTTSGILGGMPVAVIAGLCLPAWRKGAGVQVPIPTDRIVMVDVRKQSPDEAKLIWASDITVVPVAGPEMGSAIERLASENDLIYVHIDLDVLDESLVPSHLSRTPNGPDIDQTLVAVQKALDTGKVAAFALVSVYSLEPRGDESLASATALLQRSVAHWASISDP